MAQTSVMFQRSHKQIWVLPVSVPGAVVAEGVDVEGAEEDSLQEDVEGVDQVVEEEGADQVVEEEGALPEAGVAEVVAVVAGGAWVAERKLWSNLTGSRKIPKRRSFQFSIRHAGVFIARGKEDALVTKNMVMGESVYGEKRIAVEDEAGKVVHCFLKKH